MSPPAGGAHLAIWAIAAAATAGVIVRPFRWPEAVWACAGAGLLVATGLLPLGQALEAVGKGGDVYLFLVGMMLLSEVARREGLFDWVAAAAVNRANRSPRRLFVLVYAVGVVVTAFLSNDAAAVVLTPAVYAAARAARLEPLPYLFICAFVANAASFVLPISNPANIVLYGDHVPPLGAWLKSFALPSVAAIAATYVGLRLVEGRSLPPTCACDQEIAPLSPGGWTALAGIAATAAVLLTVSALDLRLGAPTCALGVLTAAIVWVRKREAPWATLRHVSWSVLPLVAGLFVLVQALEASNAIAALAAALTRAQAAAPAATPWALGGLIALASNLMNNLPAGLIASSTLAAAHPPRAAVDALLIGVDLGPNLSVTGSLATILWLTAIRREGEDVGFWRFLKLGAAVMPPALMLALAARLLEPL
ncbi:MAG: arsenic transporter [Caulobacteraceae bacterium]|nr:arsenic transporter [Caulobacter sp.]